MSMGTTKVQEDFKSNSEEFRVETLLVLENFCDLLRKKQFCKERLFNEYFHLTRSLQKLTSVLKNKEDLDEKDKSE